MAEKDYKPPPSAEELLERYAAGERMFRNARLCGARLAGADLNGADLSGGDLTRAELRGANLNGAELLTTYFTFADLSGADLSNSRMYTANFDGAVLTEAKLMGARLSSARFVEARLERADLSWAECSLAAFARADLSKARLESTYLKVATFDGANLSGVDLSSAYLCRTRLRGARLGDAILCMTNLLESDLSSLCEASPPVQHRRPSYIDHGSIVLSARSPNLKDFLQRAGLPVVFIEHTVDCARAMGGSLVKKLLQSTFISYGDVDEHLARRLHEVLHRNGVTTFFYAEHAKPGEKIHRVIRESVESYDRILVLCSRQSLTEPRVLQAIDECLAREARDGAAEYLIPVELDDCLRIEGSVLRKDLVRTLRDRVCADFRGAQEDEEVFNAGLRRLIAALRPPTWRSGVPLAQRSHRSRSPAE